MAATIDVRTAASMITDGCTITQIAEHFDVSPATVRNHVTNLYGDDWWAQHVTSRRGAPADLDTERAAQMICDGAPIRVVADALGASPATIRWHVRRDLGGRWWTDNVTDRRKVDADHAAHMLLEGQTVGDVAKHFSTHGQTVKETVIAQYGHGWWAQHVTCRWTTHIDIDTAAGMIEGGATVAAAAAALGTAPATLRHHVSTELGERWWREHVTGRQKAQLPVDDIARQLTDGQTVASMCSKYDVSYRTLRTHIEDAFGAAWWDRTVG